jgi:hypothetical protein
VSAFIGTMRAMNYESAVHAAREACKGKTFASDPDAFKELEAAKVRRNAAKDPQCVAKRYEKWAAKLAQHGSAWRARHWQNYARASESEEVMIRWGLMR